MEYENPWQYKGKAIEQDDLDGHLAFVYRITNLKSKRSYIGKKLLQKVKTRQVKGKKKKSSGSPRFCCFCGEESYDKEEDTVKDDEDE